jgi:acyl carrier protein
MGPAAVRRRVVTIVAAATLLPPEQVAAAGSLFELPGYDSLAVVDVLGRLAGGFGIDVPPEAVLPEVFGRVDGLTALVCTALERDGRDALEEVP